MINLLPRLEREFPWLHERSVSVEDCHDFCERLGVHVVYQHGVPFGVYALSEGEHFIFLHPALSGWMLLYVFCHEIGHYLFHAPTQSNVRTASDSDRIHRKLVLEFFNTERKRRNDIEAEQVAALMLLPMHEIPDLYDFGAHEAIPELGKLIEVRHQCEKFIQERNL
jgi:Zn-dependent peptidase ImmA (M78 family)